MGMWIAVLIVATLLIGNIAATFQQSVKRMLAYSVFLMQVLCFFAVFAMNESTHEGLIIYAAGCNLATIGIFAIVTK